MLRTTVFVACQLALIITPIYFLAAFEMEGTVGPFPSRSAMLSHIETAAASALPDKWNCDKPEGIVKIRDAEFCQTMVPGALAHAPGSVRYRILIEKGLEEQAEEFVTRVEAILGRDSGWALNGLRFSRVVEGFDLTILLAVPASVDRLCRPLSTDGWLSCAIDRRAMINATRWREGAITWGDDILGYHHYLINHEVGHLLGLKHADCPAEGSPAPIMLQQTISLNGCTANGSATPRDLAMLSRIMPYLERRLSGTVIRRPRIRRTRYKRRANVRRQPSRRRKR